MNTLKHLIKNLANVVFPTSALDGIVTQGFSPIKADLPEDWELYGRGNDRIVYNGKTDEVIDRYSL
jgi:methenyltetrahydromethanopterin cyclohydrolase